MSDLVAGLPVWPAYARPPPAPVGRRRPASSAQRRQGSSNTRLRADGVAIDQRQQFVELKRLGKIRGRPDLRRPLGGITRCREHHDGRVLDRLLPVDAGKRLSIHYRHFHVEQNQGHRLSRDHVERGGAMVGGDHRIAVESQYVRDGGQNRRVVVDHQDR